MCNIVPENTTCVLPERLNQFCLVTRSRITFGGSGVSSAFVSRSIPDHASLFRRAVNVAVAVLVSTQAE